MLISSRLSLIALVTAATAACATPFPAPIHPLAGAPEGLRALHGDDVELVLARVDRARVRLTAVDPKTTPLIARYLEKTGEEATGIVLHVDRGDGECAPSPASPCTSGALEALTADGSKSFEVHVSPPKDAPPNELAALLWALGLATFVTPALSLATGTDLMSAPKGAPPSQEALDAFEAIDAEQERAGLYTTRVTGRVSSYGRRYRNTAAAPIHSASVDLYVWFGDVAARTRCIVVLRAAAQPLLRGEALHMDSRAAQRIDCVRVDLKDG